MLQDEAVLDSEEQFTGSDAPAWDLNECRLVALAVDGRVRLAVLGVEVLVDVGGVLVSAVTELAALLVSPEGVVALVAVVGVTLKGLHDVLLVSLKLPHREDGLSVDDDRGRHAGCAS